MLTLLLCGDDVAIAGVLADRLDRFPHWQNQPPVKVVATGDLVYPQWMAGTWQVSSTLLDMVAPLAPQLVTPGFESNRRYLNQSVNFLVKFGAPTTRINRLQKTLVPIRSVRNQPDPANDSVVVADRAFNGLNIAKAYLGDDAIVSVQVDPENPNRQITKLAGDRQLVSIVTGRESEKVNPDRFVATEIVQQIFQGNREIYLNQVETTTAYQLQKSGAIAANQITAIYLSPKDPDYFAAAERPVALYRYQLELLPIE